MLEEQEAVRGRLFTIQDVMQSTVRAWLQVLSKFTFFCYFKRKWSFSSYSWTSHFPLSSPAILIAKNLCSGILQGTVSVPFNSIHIVRYMKMLTCISISYQTSLYIRSFLCTFRASFLCSYSGSKSSSYPQFGCFWRLWSGSIDNHWSLWYQCGWNTRSSKYSICIWFVYGDSFLHRHRPDLSRHALSRTKKSNHRRAG